MAVRKVAPEDLGQTSMDLSVNSAVDQQRMGQARDLATQAHAQQRYGRKPYVDHLVAVVQILHDFRAPADMITAGWLHDTVEDTTVTLDQIRGAFGDRVAQLVWAVTGEGNGDRRAHSRSIYCKLTEYPDATVIKLADRIANVEACETADKHYLRYAREHEAFQDAIERWVPKEMWERYVLALQSKAPV